MKRFFKRFYLSFNLTYTIAVLVLFLNNVSLVNNNSLPSIFNFFLSFLVYIALTTMLILFENKLFYNKIWLVVLYVIIAFLFPLYALLNISQTLLYITSGIILILLLIKVFMCHKSEIKFEVNYLKFIPKIYFVILFSIVVLNVTLLHYIASIFLIIPILLVEFETYLVTKSNNQYSELNLFIVIFLVMTTFFISYYSNIGFKPNISSNLLTSVIMPVIAGLIVLLLSNQLNKKVNEIIEIDTIK